MSAEAAAPPRRWPNLAVALLALIAVTVALANLAATTRGVTTQRVTIGATPATIFRPATAARGPVVLIAHGFAGSQQLMRPFAISFARAGYTAVTFDFEGHGRNPTPMSGSVTEESGATAALVAETARVAAFARPLGDGRLAVLGHSMASDIVVRFANAGPGVAATIAVSMFSTAITPTRPRNLLVVVGDWEGMLKSEALRAVGLASAPAPASEATTYGDPARGTGRRAAFSGGVEHIGVLYSSESMAEALAWADASFGRAPAAPHYLDQRGPWLVLLLAGLVALARPLATLLPVVAAPGVGAALAWRALWPCLVIPATATPLILRVLPTRFLPVVVADYLALHLLLYGLLTIACLRWRGRLGALVPARLPVLAAAALALTLYGAVALGLSIDREITSFAAGPARAPVILALLAGTLAFFLADEWLTRGPGAARGAPLVSKLALLLSLGLAVALDFERLFFLLIILPVIVPVLLIYGLFGGWAYHRTGHPLVAGLASAVAFAWAIGVTFPLLAA